MNNTVKSPIIRGIYLMVSPTNKYYVGKSKDCYDRQKDYHKPICYGQPAIFNSLKKYGFNEHSWQIIHILNDDEDEYMLNHYEKYYIKYYKDCGYIMLNLTEGGEGVVLTEEIKLRMRITNQYFQYEIINIKNGELHITSNIEKFCEDNGNLCPSNLNSTLYYLDRRGRNCKNTCDFKILSKIHLRNSELHNETQIYIKNERIRRANLKYEREKNHILHNRLNEYNSHLRYLFEILNINTKKIDYSDNLSEFCKVNNISCAKALGATLFGYFKDGKKISHTNNFRIVSKHLLNFDINKDLKLQQHIENERLVIMWKRELNNICDKSSEQFIIKNRIKNEKLLYKILHIPTNEVIESINLQQFSIKFLNKKSSLTLHNSLYGYTHGGAKTISDGDYKLISKSYIDKNQNNDKLQQEIVAESLRRSKLKYA